MKTYTEYSNDYFVWGKKRKSCLYIQDECFNSQYLINKQFYTYQRSYHKIAV